LIVAWQTGIKYHLVASGGPGAHKLAWAMLGLVAALLGGVATAAILMRPQTLPQANVTAFGENGGPYESSSVATKPEMLLPATPGGAPTVPVPPEVRGWSKTGPRDSTWSAWAKAAPSAAPAPVVASRVTRTFGPLTPPWAGKPRSAEELQKQLRDQVPEISLQSEVLEVDYRAEMRIKDLARAIANKNKENPDAFVFELMATRSDLAGLSWRRTKDCQLSPQAALPLEDVSLKLREALDLLGAKDEKAWLKCLNKQAGSPSAEPWYLAGIHQILSAENRDLRLYLIDRVGSGPATPATTEVIAQRAIFDIDPEVREKAIESLKQAHAVDYIPVFLKALRHPWLPAAQHAAEALVALQTEDAVWRLVSLLDEPDAGAPIYKTLNGRQVVMVREVVRVNHLRNCLLCHAPSFDEGDPIRAPIPVPGTPLPKTSRKYYAEISRATRVRADITYLRQDFSVKQPVAAPGKWPKDQRYDYLLRERELTTWEQIAWSARQEGNKTVSGHKDAIVFALRGLTGLDGGDTARQWQEALTSGAVPDPAAAGEQKKDGKDTLKEKIDKAELVVIGKLTETGLSAASSFDVGVVEVKEVLKGDAKVKTTHIRIPSRGEDAEKYGKKGAEGVWILDKEGGYLAARPVLLYQPPSEIDAVKKLLPKKDKSNDAPEKK
jgi:hypothetical protein